MGAMVFGGVDSEQLQFNEKTLWTGGPGSSGYNNGNWTSPRPTALQEVVDAINTDGTATPSWVAGKLGQAKSGYGAYQTFGNLDLKNKVTGADSATFMMGAGTDYAQSYRLDPIRLRSTSSQDYRRSPPWEAAGTVSIR
jgi:hypothetical protein